MLGIDSYLARPTYHLTIKNYICMDFYSLPYFEEYTCQAASGTHVKLPAVNAPI